MSRQRTPDAGAALAWGGGRGRSRTRTRPGLQALHHPALASLGWWLGLLAVALHLCVSAQTLAHFGVPYDLPGGSPLVKLHPGTWVMSLALVVALLARGHPLASLGRTLIDRPAVGLGLACMVLVGLWSVARYGSSGAAFIVDTLWMPGLAMLWLSLHGRGQHRQLLYLMVGLLVLNSAIGLVEYALRVPLVPRPGEELGLAAERYFRSTALLGHPLANALNTVALLPAVLLLRGHGGMQWPLLLVLSLSLLAFGSRSALAVGALVYLGGAVVVLGLRAVRGRYSYLRITGGLLAIMATLTVVVAAVWASGLGERIFATLTWDNSANVRLVAWQALDRLDAEGWWLGVPPARIEVIAESIGLDLRYEAIENFWIALLMQFGMVGFVPFAIGLTAYLVHAARRAAPTVWLSLPVYLLVASGANTLAAKSVSLTLLCLMLLASSAWVVDRQPGRRGAVRPLGHRPGAGQGGVTRDLQGLAA